jgi:hypothetical protein
VIGLLLLLPQPSVQGQQKKRSAPSGQARVLFAAPLGVAPGVPTRLTLRGLKLDTVTEVRCHEPKAKVKLLSKGKAAVPAQQDVNRVGDSQAEIELTLPDDYSGTTVTVAVVTADGESPPHKLLVDRLASLAEKEPNNGFRQAQPIQVPQIVEGRIAHVQDVDTFRFDGKAGQKLVLEIFAARYGSSLDSFLTLYDANGQIVASNDDGPDSTDSRIAVTLPRTGAYYVSVIDVNDLGGPAHVYRLSVREK